MAELLATGAPTTEEPTTSAPGATLRSVSCPRCAGPLTARDGDHVITCDRCGTPFRTMSPGGFERRFFPAKVERLRAVGRASCWLRDHPDTPPDISAAAFTEARLLYVPIWEVRAHVVGWEFGRKLRTKAELVQVGREEVVQTRLVEEAVEAGFLNERRHYQEAADLRALGMGRPHITGREFTLPYLVGELERGATVLEADRDLEVVRERAREAFLRPPTGTVSRQTRLFLLRESAALIYYPLWSLRYSYRGRLYEMTVDGRSGQVHSARAPADNRARVAVLLASYAALAMGLALAVSAWEALEGFREPAVYTMITILVAASGVYWRFRLLREVEYHEPFSA
ncbi:MAG: hypothetical protein ACYC6T_06815 [Thermoleophilia bacterium]